MKKILLANIGNRNLNYKNQPLVSHFDTKDNTIRSFSQDLLNRVEKVHTDLSIEIVDRLIEQEKEGLEKIVLYGSDQADSNVNDQDTIYVAQIVKDLIQRQFPNIQVQVEAIQSCSVVDNDGLLSYYRKQLLTLLFENPEDEFLICDAGGTAQQKSSLKIMAEFILTSTRYRAWYQNIKTQHMEEVGHEEYRRVITEEQVSILVQKGEYVAALVLIQNSSAKEEMIQMLKLASSRKEMLFDDAKAAINTRLEDINTFYGDFRNQNLYKNSELNSIIKNGKLFLIIERLEWTVFLYGLGNLTNSVLSFQIFTESFLEELLNALLPEFKNATQNRKIAQELVEYIKKEYPQVDAYFEGGIKGYSLPVQIKFLSIYCENSDCISVKDILEKFEYCNSVLNMINKYKYSGLDQLRNRIAHDGIGVKWKQLNKAVPNYEYLLQQMRMHFGLPPENSFDTMNHIILNHLRKS